MLEKNVEIYIRTKGETKVRRIMKKWKDEDVNTPRNRINENEREK